MARKVRYLPEKEVDLNLWFQNFLTMFSASPSTYGPYDATDSNVIRNAVIAFETAILLNLGASSSKNTRLAKNTAEATALRRIIPYADSIKHNPSVSLPDKIALRLFGPERRPPSLKAPDLQVIRSSNLCITLAYLNGYKKDKPEGVVCCDVWCRVSPFPIIYPELMLPFAQPTKSPFTLQFNPIDGGLTAYIVARWLTEDGNVSTWSRIMPCTVPVLR
jgi:hypothetical protein